MQKKIILTIILIATTIAVKAQDIRSIFIDMPDSIISGLIDRGGREDCFDFLDSKMPAKITNMFGEETEMVSYNSRQIHMRIGKNNTWYMLILPQKESNYLIAIITTYSLPQKDSDIKFYDSKWKPLPTEDYIKTPSKSDYLKEPKQGDDYEDSNAYASANIMLQEIMPNDKTSDLEFKYTTLDYLPIGYRNRLKKMYKGNIKMKWNGRHYYYLEKE